MEEDVSNVMKHGNGIKGQDDRSSGIEILISDAFAKINTTDNFRLTKQVVRRKRNCCLFLRSVYLHQNKKGRRPRVKNVE